MVEKVIFGSVILYRSKCPKCRQYMLSSNSFFECTTRLCDHEWVDDQVEHVRKEISGKRRKALSPMERRQLIADQDNRCFWCGREFGSWVSRKNKLVALKCHIDHVTPYIYSESDRFKNKVASCHICNRWKSSKIFETVTECEIYLQNKWATEIASGKIKE